MTPPSFDVRTSNFVACSGGGACAQLAARAALPNAYAIRSRSRVPVTFPPIGRGLTSAPRPTPEFLRAPTHLEHDLALAPERRAHRLREVIEHQVEAHGDAQAIAGIR